MLLIHFSTGEDNAEAPSLPKTPSTSRRLRGRPPKTKKKQTGDGSPVLTRTLRSRSKRNDQQKDDTDDPEPLQDIGNSTAVKRSSVKADENVEDSFRKSSRTCAVRASQVIAEQSTVKKNARRNVKRADSSSSNDDIVIISPTTDMLSKLETLDSTTKEDSSSVLQNTVEKVTLQQSPPPVSDQDNSPVLEPVSFLQGRITNKNVVSSPELTPPASHCHCQSTEEVEQLLIIDVDDESTPLAAHSSHVEHYFSPVKEVTPTTATVASNADQNTSIRSSTKPKSVCKDELFTPPDNVNSEIAGEHQAESENESTTVSKQMSTSYSQMDTPEVICDSHASSSDLARLTRLTSSQLKTPDTVTKNNLTPTTVVKSSTTVTQTSSSESSTETPVTVTKQSQSNHVSATVTKVKHSANVARKAADGSPEFLTAVKRPQEFQTCSTSVHSGTTKKQRVTPTNCFSPARPKVIYIIRNLSVLHLCLLCL